MMRIVLDQAACQGHGRCYALSPTLFESDDEGFARLRDSGEVGGADEAAAVLAADSCPEYAITIERD